eukprot:COSAG01_NODE_2629_length_7348_cov_14.364414_7_plen_149_part_00
MLTSTELKEMGVKANMRLDQKTIDQVLAAVRLGKLPNKDESNLKIFMKECGLEAWYSYIVTHLGCKTRQDMVAITSSDLMRLSYHMHSAVNIRLSMDKIQEILAAVRKGNERHKQLEVYMESCGMELWHSHFLKHRCSFYMARVSPVH